MFTCLSRNTFINFSFWLRGYLNIWSKTTCLQKIHKFQVCHVLLYLIQGVIRNLFACVMRVFHLCTLFLFLTFYYGYFKEYTKVEIMTNSPYTHHQALTIINGCLIFPVIFSPPPSCIILKQVSDIVSFHT